MVARTATFHKRRYSAYVPAAAYAADVISNGPHQVDFGNPVVADADAILDGQDIASAGTAQGLVGTVPLLIDELAAPFGRNVTVVADGAATSNVTVRGRDYLGQPMVESFTLNGNTPVAGKKAFKWIDSITWGATASRTIDVGFGAIFGLPYRMSRMIGTEEVDGASNTAGTFVAGVLTDPQTATTGDPRGTYAPNTTPDGVKRIRASFFPNNLINANGNGGLYGIAHYYG